ncbi:site-specific integrase [Micromonospora inositola]|nr:site-specific integrase [Micromonospora inositola]
MARGDWIDPARSRVTVGAWAAQWMAAEVQLKPTTRARYELALRRQVLPMWGEIPLSAVSHAEVAAWVQRLTASGLAPATVRYAHVGTPIHPRNDYRSFREIIRQAGLRQVRLHDLRHTAASVLLAQGVPARVVMEILGHSQISVTLNIYAHVAPEIARKAAARLEGALWSSE